MSYIYTALKPHLCKDVIGIIEDMVRWEGKANSQNVVRDDDIFHIKEINDDLFELDDSCEPAIIYDSNFIGDTNMKFYCPSLSVIQMENLSFEMCLKFINLYTVSGKHIMYSILKINENCYMHDIS